MYYSSSILVCMDALGMSIIDTSLPSSASIKEVKSTDSRNAVGEAASYLSMAPSCLLPLATIINLKTLSLFSFRNRLESGTSLYYYLMRVNGYSGSNVLQRCSYLVHLILHRLLFYPIVSCLIS